MNAGELQCTLGVAGTVALVVTAVLAVTPRGIDLFQEGPLGVVTEGARFSEGRPSRWIE